MTNEQADTYREPLPATASCGPVCAPRVVGAFPARFVGSFTPRSGGAYPARFRGAYPARFRGAYPARFRGAYPARYRGAYPARYRGAFTLIELLVVVGIISLLLSILLPSLGKARERARLVVCQSNLRSIGHGVAFYLGDNRDIFPAARIYGVGGYERPLSYYSPLGTDIPEKERPLNVYLENIDIFACPSDKGDPVLGFDNFFAAHGTSYSYASHAKINSTPPPDNTTVTGEIDDPNRLPPSYGVQSCRRHPRDPQRDGLPLGLVARPARKVVFLEPPLSPAFANPSAFVTGYPEDVETYRSVFADNAKAHWHSRERQHGNVLFADAHVEFILFNEEQINASELGPWLAPWDQGDPNRPYY